MTQLSQGAFEDAELARSKSIIFAVILGRLLGKMRLEKETDLETLARRTGVGEVILSGIESGRLEVCTNTLVRVCRALDGDVCELFSRAEELTAQTDVEAFLADFDADSLVGEDEVMELLEEFVRISNRDVAENLRNFILSISDQD